MSTFKRYYDDPDYRKRHIARQKEEIECPGCGAVVTRQSYNLHCKSEKHKNNLKKSEQELELEKELNEIERVCNKKIRAMKRKKERELEKLDARIENIKAQ